MPNGCDSVRIGAPLEILSRSGDASARVRTFLDGYYIEGTVSHEAMQNALDAVADARWFKESDLPRHVEADPKQSSWHNELGYDPATPLEALDVPAFDAVRRFRFLDRATEG